ncbi:hypothetical protein MIND_01281300 [Mycena indigotica]|uniref:Uncharacterized protein n=1 Tax=Mycena indigotica TaxID=2126181 RepID=A0A8H6S2Y6_9AGAR|nr:uncharacterized protein MIND_01281300 [Mycena indigotica]KAF7291368.1 hypothetical protein MIND_01281300 [Mycena indigotica]
MTTVVPSPVPDADPAAKWRFPPFPPPPPGVSIVPFADFVECGIQVFGEWVDGAPRDGRGIVTVVLPARTKDTTAVEGGVAVSKKKKKKKKTQAVVAAAGDWWTVWAGYAAHERFRVPYDSAIDPISRLHMAYDDFEQYYGIPQLTASSHKYVWDIVNALKYFVGADKGLSNMKLGHGSEGGDGAMDDDDDGFGDDGDFDLGAPVGTTAEESQLEISAETRSEQGDGEPAPRFRKAQAFLDDPAYATQVFLSSHLIDKGLCWEQRKLIAAPHVMRFFLTFLHRTGVIAKSDFDNAMLIVQTASVDLPGTLAVSNAYEIKFEMDERPAKRAKIDGETENIELENGTTLVGQTVDSDELMGGDSGGEQNNEDANGWGGSGGWGDPETTENTAGWGEPASTTAEEPKPIPTLASILGNDTRAAAVKERYTPGLVERAMRRIASVGTDGPLAKVVLAPWPDWKPSVPGEQDNGPTVLRPSGPHDSYTDDITLRVLPACAAVLAQHVGLGVWGTWVRVDAAGPAGDDDVDVEGWYVQDVTLVIPSYWAAATGGVWDV